MSKVFAKYNKDGKGYLTQLLRFPTIRKTPLCDKRKYAKSVFSATYVLK